MRRHARPIVGGVVGLVMLAACGSSKTTARGPTASTSTTVAGAPDPNAKESLPPGDIPDNQVFVTYRSAAGGYSLSYPQGWAQREISGTTTFSQYFNSIGLTTAKNATAPTIASARSLASATLRSLPGYKLIKIDSVTRAAGPAVHIVYDATSAVDAVTGKTVTLQVERYLFWHKGTLLTITLSSAKGSDNVDPWKTVTDSLVWQ